jgi:hypothetical protein
VATSEGRLQEYDHVIMATHSDTALSILKNGHGLTALEARLLGSFRWNYNDVALHSDISVGLDSCVWDERVTQFLSAATESPDSSFCVELPDKIGTID